MLFHNDKTFFLVLLLFANFVFQFPQSLREGNEMCCNAITLQVVLPLHDSNFILLNIGSKRRTGMTDKMKW